MNKLIAALAVASALGVASGAVAGPMQMSDNQLDQVTAGAHATATAGGLCPWHDRRNIGFGHVGGGGASAY